MNLKEMLCSNDIKVVSAALDILDIEYNAPHNIISVDSKDIIKFYHLIKEYDVLDVNSYKYFKREFRHLKNRRFIFYIGERYKLNSKSFNSCRFGLTKKI